MLRTVLGAVAVFLASTTLLLGADDKKDAKAEKRVKATITKVDAKNGTITVKMKDKEGKEVERKFKLAEDIRYLDSTGKVVAIDVFESGNDVLVVEEDGHLKEMRKEPKAKKNTEPKTEKK